MFTLHPFTARGRALAALPHRYAESCVTVGFFDGVHRGHRFLLDRLQEEAAQRGLSPVAVTFDEHPRLVLSPEGYWPQLITTTEEKLALLAESGIDACAVLHFTPETARLTSAEFMEQLLLKQLGAKCLMAGYDHRFGSDREAGFAQYAATGRRLGMDVLRAPAFSTADLTVSSSAARRMLAAGNVAGAYECLGRYYRLTGTVEEGRHVGREVGFPTANLAPDSPEKIVPGRGVYAIRAYVDGFAYEGMLNIGRRPTLNDGRGQTIEAHLFDYDGTPLYGRRLTLEFVARVRDEQQFASLDELRAQLKKDAEMVRGIFAK